MRSLLIVIVALGAIRVSAGAERNGPGARPSGLANSFVAIADGPWSVFYNPAGLARISALSASVYVSPAPYGLKELRSISAAAAYSLQGFAFGAMVEQFGSALYRETTLSFSSGFRAAERIAVGMTLHVKRTEIERYGAASRMVVDAGAIAEVAGDISLGCAWKNLNGTTMGEVRDQQPRAFILGVCYETSNDSRATVEVEKEIRYAFIKKLGFEHRFFGLLTLRLGVSDEPNRFSCGVGFRIADWEVSYAGSSHARLGWTHQIEASFVMSR